MPNRIIKESIRTSKTVNSLSDFQFRLWVYLITYVDDYGRGSADPELLKGFVFPRRKRVSESDIKNTLAELAGMGCIILYEVDGESYFYFPNWGEHQRIQTKKSKYPAPDDGILLESTVTHRDSPPESESNTNPNTNPKSESKTSAGFDTFWEQYPRHIAKEAARKAWSKLNPSEELQEQIIAAVLVYKASPQWTKDGGQYIPHPSTFLNQRRWEDEIVGSSEDYYQRLFNQFAEEEANE